MKNANPHLVTRAGESQSSRSLTGVGSPLILLLLYLLTEYGRPQSFFPVIGALHPGWIINLSLLILLISRKKLFSMDNPQTKLFWVITVLMLIHGPFAINTYWSYEIWRGMVLYLIMYLSVTSFVDSFHKLGVFINALTIILMVGALVGIKNGGKIPNSAFMGDENDFALVMNMGLSLSYFLLFTARSKAKRLMYLLGSALFVGANVASLSRGGFIGLVSVAMFCWLMTPRKVLSTLIAAMLVATLLLSAPPGYWNEVRSIKKENVEEGTGAERWYTWKCGWRMFLDNPIFGVGQGNFAWNVARYEPPEKFHGKSLSGRAAHSLYFTLLPELGAIGVFCFFGMLFLTLRDVKYTLSLAKRRISHWDEGKHAANKDWLVELKYYVLGILGAFVGYLTSGIFLSVLYYPHFWLLVAIMVSSRNIAKAALSTSDA